MNKKQKSVLGITSLIFVPPVVVGLVMSIESGNYDFFRKKMLEELPLVILNAHIAGFLLYIFRDKKTKNQNL